MYFSCFLQSSSGSTDMQRIYKELKFNFIVSNGKIHCKYIITISVCGADRGRLFPHKLTGPQLLKKFTAFYGTQRFIIAFTRASRPLCLNRNMFKILQ